MEVTINIGLLGLGLVLNDHKVHIYVKVNQVKLHVIFLNKATSNRFGSLSPIFSIPVNNDKVDISHNFGCHGHHFDGKLCAMIVTKILYY